MTILRRAELVRFASSTLPVTCVWSPTITPGGVVEILWPTTCQVIPIACPPMVPSANSRNDLDDRSRCVELLLTLGTLDGTLHVHGFSAVARFNPP